MSKLLLLFLAFLFLLQNALGPLLHDVIISKHILGPAVRLTCLFAARILKGNSGNRPYLVPDSFSYILTLCVDRVLDERQTHTAEATHRRLYQEAPSGDLSASRLRIPIHSVIKEALPGKRCLQCSTVSYM
jgi:hypothetical protein